MQVKARVTTSFEGVREWSDEFLSLFPHRFDYIYASYPEPGNTPNWQTESRHPLSDRLIRQGSYLYGVRFGSETNYCLLDIDSGSLYHPKRDPFAVSRISAALEDLGLVSYVACTSSYSGGLHLYFPFEQPQKSWSLAVAVQTLLENAGFKLALGQLEVFPNPKLYVTSGKPNLYAAHRLPMQAGSYLLNDRYEMIYSSFDLFVQQWQFACQRNDVQSVTVEGILKSSRRKQYCISGKADKFLNDLNADIEPGWTGYGQTNYILGRIAMRSYVFGHLLYGAYPLEGKALVDDIVGVAKALPGYQQWCRHQHEIEKRAEEWARCVENSRYFHFGTRKLKSATSDLHTESHALTTKQRLTWNQRQSDAARGRIKNAIADMLEKQLLPSSPTERFRALTRYQIGGGSLYRHRDLWHPSYFFESTAESEIESTQLSIDIAFETEPTKAEPTKESKSVENIPVFLFQNDGCEEDCGKPASSSPHLTSLLVENGCNSNVQAASSHFSMSTPEAAGGNIQPQLAWLESTLTTAKDVIEQRTQHRIQAQQTAHLARLQRYLTSGDPILMAEAIALTQTPSHPQPPCPLSSAMSVDGREDKPDGWPPLLNWARALLQDDDPDDFSNILVAISVQLRRLGWSPHSISDRLYGLFGKRHQMLLTDHEIFQWLEYLEQQNQ
jgi:hypothetical protein